MAVDLTGAKTLKRGSAHRLLEYCRVGLTVLLAQLLGAQTAMLRVQPMTVLLLLGAWKRLPRQVQL